MTVTTQLERERERKAIDVMFYVLCKKCKGVRNLCLSLKNERKKEDNIKRTNGERQIIERMDVIKSRIDGDFYRRSMTI